jgi:hypothetical protein
VPSDGLSTLQCMNASPPEPLGHPVANPLRAVPPHIKVSPDVDLASQDPALVAETGRRRCVAVRSAGGRCTVTPLHTHVICGAHAGVLDPREGALARAAARRQARVTAEERARLARLGARGAIVEALASKAAEVRRAVEVLADAAAAGDLPAAKLLCSYLTQGYGAPAEQVIVETPQTADDVRRLPTAELLRLVRESE